MPRVSQTTTKSFRAAAKQIKAAGAELERRLMLGPGAGVRLIADEIMTDVKASRPGHGVPRRKGILAGTGRVDGPRRSGRHRTLVVLGFGGAAARYALVQHERADFHHRLGEARYLVRGVERWKPGAALDALKRNAQEGLAVVARRAGAALFGRP